MIKDVIMQIPPHSYSQIRSIKQPLSPKSILVNPLKSLQPNGNMNKGIKNSLMMQNILH